MTEEIGSDAQLAAVADMETVRKPVVDEEARLAEEESRVNAASESDDEPGTDHPEPEPPSIDEPHDEFDPMPDA